MTVLSVGQLKALRQKVGGVVTTPGEADYDAAVSIWNGAIDRRPAVVVRATSARDVSAAFQYGREADLEISVRGGGHNFAGFALCDGGLMIDLSLMRDVVVSPEMRRAAAGGGATWGDMDTATQAHGLAVPGGFISHTGIAGLTLGGGIGWLARKAGLSCDNLVAADVVLPDGSLVQASEDDNQDLLWGLKGGGGNFGVVTSFEYDLHEVGPMVNLALFFFSLDQGGEMMRFARDLIRDLPDDAGGFIGGLNAPPEPFVPEEYQLQPGYALVVVGFGDADHHAELIAPVRKALRPRFEFVTPIPYAGLQSMLDASAPWGVLGYEKAVNLDELSDAAIDVIVEHQPRKASPLSFTPILTLGGAYSRVADDATAFGGSRSTQFVVNIAAVCPTPELFKADREWVRNFWSDLSDASGVTASYVNFMSEFEEDRVRASYGAVKYERLMALKAKYDPDNVLHLNANIQPRVKVK
jgi:FAD/FMN-containing dehydrogenase